MPNISHEPTKAFKDTVSLHAMVGTPQETIASILNIDAKTLRKYYREELDHALAKANASIGGSLFNKAKNGDTTAQIFWLKTRAGFSEKKEEEKTVVIHNIMTVPTAASAEKWEQVSQEVHDKNLNDH